MNLENDPYQRRYLEHQERKKEVLKQIIDDRHSDRRFGEGEVPREAFVDMLEVVERCPSSCDRKAIDVLVVEERDEKALLGGILVGGVGWREDTPDFHPTNPSEYKKVVKYKLPKEIKNKFKEL